MGIFAFVMLGLLATQVVLLTDQLRTVRTQRSIAERQAARTLPLLDAVRPLVADLDTAAETAPAWRAWPGGSLSAQLDALAILKESLAIQHETLRHAESLDRKTGPSAAPPPVTTPARADP